MGRKEGYRGVEWAGRKDTGRLSGQEEWINEGTVIRKERNRGVEWGRKEG